MKLVENSLRSPLLDTWIIFCRVSIDWGNKEWSPKKMWRGANLVVSTNYAIKDDHKYPMLGKFFVVVESFLDDTSSRSNCTEGSFACASFRHRHSNVLTYILCKPKLVWFSPPLCWEKVAQKQAMLDSLNWESQIIQLTDRISLKKLKYNLEQNVATPFGGVWRWCAE